MSRKVAKKSEKTEQIKSVAGREAELKDILRGIEIKKIELRTLVERGGKLLRQAPAEEARRLFDIVSKKEHDLGGPGALTTHDVGWLCGLATDLSVRAKERK